MENQIQNLKNGMIIENCGNVYKVVSLNYMTNVNFITVVTGNGTMEYIKFENDSETIKVYPEGLSINHLQGIGSQLAKEAKDFTIGETVIFNFGQTDIIEKIEFTKSGKSLDITFKSGSCRRFRATKLLCFEYVEPTKEDKELNESKNNIDKMIKEDTKKLKQELIKLFDSFNKNSFIDEFMKNRETIINKGIIYSKKISIERFKSYIMVYIDDSFFRYDFKSNKDIKEIKTKKQAINFINKFTDKIGKLNEHNEVEKEGYLVRKVGFSDKIYYITKDGSIEYRNKMIKELYDNLIKANPSIKNFLDYNTTSAVFEFILIYE